MAVFEKNNDERPNKYISKPKKYGCSFFSSRVIERQIHNFGFSNKYTDDIEYDLQI